MQKRYWLTLVVSVTATLVHGEAFAQSWTQCKATEFAEMQTMSKSELVTLYCRNKNTQKAASEQVMASREAALKALQLAGEAVKDGDKRGYLKLTENSNEYSKEASKYGNDELGCITENGRVFRLIKKADDKAVAPSCE